MRVARQSEHRLMLGHAIKNCVKRFIPIAEIRLTSRNINRRGRLSS